MATVSPFCYNWFGIVRWTATNCALLPQAQHSLTKCPAVVDEVAVDCLFITTMSPVLQNNMFTQAVHALSTVIACGSVCGNSFTVTLLAQEA